MLVSFFAYLFKEICFCNLVLPYAVFDFKALPDAWAKPEKNLLRKVNF